MEGAFQQRPVMHALRDDGAARAPSRSSSRGSLRGGLGGARRSDANLRTVRNGDGGAMKRVRSSDMLRMQIDMMQSESAEVKAKADADIADQRAKAESDMADQKAKADSDRAADRAKAESDMADQKRRHDADRDYLRGRINELRKQVSDAEKAKAMSDAGLETTLSSEHTGSSGSREEQILQKKVDDGAAEHRALEDKIAAMQAELDATAERRLEELEQAKQEGREEGSGGGSTDSPSAADAARIAELQKQMENLAAAKKDADAAGAAREKNLQDQLDQRAMADGALQTAMDDATSKERRLRQKLRMLQDEIDVSALEKKADRDQQKAAEDKLKAQLQKLQIDMDIATEEKQAAVQAKDEAEKAKDEAEKELQKAISDSASGSSADAEHTAALQRQLEDLRAMKLAHDRAGAAQARELKWELSQARNKSKHDADAAVEVRAKLEAQLTALQEAADEAAYSKLANDDVRAGLEDQLKALREEVEQAHFEKHLANEEVDRMRRDGEITSSSGASSDMNDLLAKLRASEDQVKKLQDEKDTVTLSSDESDKEVADLRKQLRQLQAAKKKGEDDAAEKQRTMSKDAKGMADVLAGLERQLEESRSAEAAMKAKADEDYGAKVNAESELKASLTSDDKETIEDLRKQLEAMTDAKTVADSELASILERSGDRSCVDDRIALLRKELYDSRVAGMAQKRAAGSKEADFEQRLKAVQEEMEAAMDAKVNAEKERDRARSSETSSSMASDERSAELQRKLDELQAAKDAMKAARDAREQKLEDGMDAMKARLATMQEDADEAAYAKLAHDAKADADKKMAKDAADAMEEDLRRQLRKMQREKDKAVFDKTMADGEVERLKASSSSDASSGQHSAENEALARKLRKAEKLNVDDKAALDDLRKDLAAMTDAKSVADSELASLLERSSDGSSVDERIALLRKELYDSRVAGMAQKRAAGSKEADLKQQLKAIKEEMEVAMDAKVTAERDRDRARSETSSSMASDERSAELQRKLDELQTAKDAVKAAGDAREKKLEEDVKRIKASRQARMTAGDAREKKLGDDLDVLKAKLATMQEEADEAAFAKLENDAKADANKKLAKDAADAMEEDLRRQLREMEREKDKAVFDQNMADGEVDRLRASSGSDQSSHSAENEALTKRLRESERRVEQLKEQRKTAQDKAAAKQKVDKDDRDALQAVLDSLQLQLEESKGGRKTEVEELEKKLRKLHCRVESAEHAQVLAEKSLDDALEDSGSGGGGGAAADEHVSMLRKELYDSRVASRADQDAGAEREKELEDRLRSIKEEAEAAAKATKDEFLSKEGDLMKRVKFLQEEMEAAMEARFEAEKERDHARTLSDGAESASMSSSSATDSQTISSLQKQLEKLEALKKAADDAGAAREAKLEADVRGEKDAGATREAKMGATIETLRVQLQALGDAADEAAYDKKETAGKHKADVDELKRQLKDAVDQKHVADEKLEKFSSDTTSSNAETKGLEDKLKKAEEKAAKAAEDIKELQDQAEEEKKWADESIHRLQEELSLLQEQAAVLASGKRVAEDEIREIKSVAEAREGMTSEVADELLVQQVQQLKAEQQLSYNIAETMYRRLDADNQALQEELEALEEKKQEVDDELARIKENELRDVYDKLQSEQTRGVELETKLKEAESSPSNRADLNDMKEQIDMLLKDLEHMTAEKEAATKRLEWEKATKRELRKKIFALQEHAETASTAKKALDKELRALQEQPETQTTESMEELAEKLKHQVQSLQEEKEETLRKMQALEHSVTTGEYEVGDSARVREAYVSKLQSDIELLETSVKHLMDENKVLLDSKERLQGEMGKGDKTKFCALDDQIQSLNSQTKELTEKLDTARKEADSAKVAQKEEKDQVLDLQHRMDKNILQLATLRSSTRMNMERIKKEHDDALESARVSGAAEVREELDGVRREREALKAALEVEKQGRKDDEQSRAVESKKQDARIVDAKDGEVSAALKIQVKELLKKNRQLEKQAVQAASQKDNAMDENDELKRQMIEKECELVEKNEELVEKNEKLSKKVRELEREAEQTRQTKEFEEEKKDAFSTSDEFVRMKSTFEKQIKDIMERNEVLAKKNESQTKKIVALENIQAQEREVGTGQNGNKAHGLVGATPGGMGDEHLKLVKAENASLKTDIVELKKKELHERQVLEQQIQSLQGQVEEYQKKLRQQNTEGSGTSTDAGRSTDLVAASESSNTVGRAHNLQQAIGTQQLQQGPQQLQQGPLAALKASRDSLLARLSRNLHNERDSLARRAHALKLSAVAAERAAEAAALMPSNPGSIERNMRDMAHTQQEFESLQSILNNYKSMYEMKDLALKETQIERDELRLELQRCQARTIE